MLCDRLIHECEIDCADADAGFAWREGNVVFDVHNGLQDRAGE
ncbi:MAG: hypothetical protein ACLQUZ_13835 [Rhizomicrobium sp.]